MNSISPSACCWQQPCPSAYLHSMAIGVCARAQQPMGFFPPLTDDVCVAYVFNYGHGVSMPGLLLH